LLGVAFHGRVLVPSTPSSLSSSLSSLGTSRSSSISLLEGGVGQCESLPLEAKKASKSSIPAKESQSLKAGEGGNDRETSIEPVKISVEKMMSSVRGCGYAMY
jgi:hypothetical protein